MQAGNSIIYFLVLIPLLNLLLLFLFFKAFPPGEHFSVPSLPNITAVNALGDFDIAADRLAIIDGEGL